MVVLIMLIGAGLVYWAVGQLYARYWNKGLSVEIRFSSDHAVKGDEIELIETVANRKYLPLPYIYVKFQTDKSLFFLGKDGSNAVSDKAYRNDVFSLMNYQQAVRRIPLRCTKRGIYRIRNVQMVSTGAFMGDVLAAESAQDAVITVYPKTADTDRLAVPCFQMMGTVERNKYLYEDHFMFRGIREYQSYDSMNQVNWTATAKSGQLMVNQYNESTCQQVCILLNVEPEGMIPKEKLSEESISIASGLAQMFIEQGIQVSLLSNARNGETGEEAVVYGASGLAHLNNVNTVLAGLDLSFSVREFKDIIKEMQNGVYGEDYRAVPGSTNMTYIMISQNRRENLKEGYRQLTGGISSNVSGGAGNGAGMWIVPYFIDEREEVFPAGMTDSMDFTAWEVDRNDG